MTAPALPEVGDLVTDISRGCEAVVTDVRNGVLLLRHRHGGLTKPWPADPGRLQLLARRGTWNHT